MTLDQLEIIHAIVEYGSFRAAAEALHKSQPALSASVKTLEAEFDLQIFDRETYRPTLTEPGEAFVEATRATLYAARQAARIAKELGRRRTESKLRVAVDPLTPVEAIELIALECARPVVPTTLILEKTIVTAGRKLLLAGSVDLAISSSESEDPMVDRIAISSVTLEGVVSRRLLQERRDADAAFLDQHAQVLVHDPGTDEPDGLSGGAIRQGTRPRILAPDHATKVHLVRSGVGWGRLTQAEIKDSGDDLVPLGDLCTSLHLHLCMMRPRFRDLGPIGQAIWKAFGKRYAVDG